MKERRHHKKFWIIPAVIVAILVVVGIWQRQNIQALYVFATTDSAQIAGDMTQSKENFEKELEPYSSGTIRDFTVEEEQEILNGTLSVEDAIAKIQNEQSQEPGATDSGSADKEQQTQAYVDAALAQMYTVKANYLGTLNGLKSAAIAEVMALPAEQRTKSNALSIGMRYVSSGYAAEDSCDAAISSILSELKGNLQSIGADTAVVSTLRTQYESQKQSMKAYYLGELQSSVASIG